MCLGPYSKLERTYIRTSYSCYRQYSQVQTGEFVGFHIDEIIRCIQVADTHPFPGGPSFLLRDCEL